ncbi:MAG: RNA polymerase sigma factor (sigma-70 family) [Saprospiraceae bacterium]|jgi:RNA polymerase sigma factor (sigma-70 family)
MIIEEYKKLVLPIKNKLFRFSLRIVGNVAEAEDVVQEVFIKVWNKRSEVESFNNLEAWCMTLTKNLSIDKLRSKHRRVDALPDTYDMPSQAASPYQTTVANDTISRIEKMMAGLPDKQRMVMQLRDIEGMSYNEISEILNITLDQVKINLFRARKDIRSQLLNSESYGL